MKFKLTLFAIICIVLININNAGAQTYSPSHLKAAETLLVAVGFKDQIPKMFDQMLEVQYANLPAARRKTYITTVNKFLEKYADWPQVKASFEPLYAAAFTEDECNKLSEFFFSDAGKAWLTKQNAKYLTYMHPPVLTTDQANKIYAFFQTPAGKAMTAKQSGLFDKAGVWGNALFVNHRDELATMVKNAEQNE